MVSITNSPATLFYAASTLKVVDTGKSHCSHTVSDSKPRVPHSHPVVFWDSEMPEHRWAFLKSYDLGFVETRNVGTPFFSFSFFFLSCLVNWECLEVWGIT